MVGFCRLERQICGRRFAYYSRNRQKRVQKGAELQEKQGFEKNVEKSEKSY